MEALIQQGIGEGATLLCGGGRPTGLPKGYYVEPTAFVADPDSIVAQQEFFGSDLPFGGYKQSGLGRENGVAGFEEYLEVKALAVPAG